MTREEIDTAWSRALGEAVKEGEQFTRYHFAAIIRAQTVDLAMEMCRNMVPPAIPGGTDPQSAYEAACTDCETAIESLKGQP